MIKALMFDLSRTLLYPTDSSYTGELNNLHKELSQDPNYNFWNHFTLDKKLMDYLAVLKEKYEICMFTSGIIQNTPELKKYLDPVFTKIYSSQDLGFKKNDLKAYEFIAADLKHNPDEIGYFDDSEENVNAAKAAGINALLFQNFERLKVDIETILLAN